MANVPRLLSLAVAAFVAACSTPLALAASVGVGVSGVRDIWPAGQPAGTVLNGGFPGSDVAPLNSPVPASSAGPEVVAAVDGT